MTTLSRVLNAEEQSLLEFVGRATFVAIVPSLSIAAFLFVLLTVVGVDIDSLMFRELRTDLHGIIAAIVLAPIIETVLMSWPIALLASSGKSRTRTAGWIGLFAGLVHAFNSPLAIVPTGWAFFVFALTYQAWRHRSYWHACLAAAGAHSLYNTVPVLLNIYLPSGVA